ncbi:branched-chain amino acid transport system permease LivM [Klebsiella pneumoniae]|uniref:Branched-chain amino acid transport system permease LivM n=1 Tax=Klebsiella pneumoniae TaxID=573 RepID=A0A3S4GK86_KLEPN|nr:branched-chain amino acid transport system permease LivM [Klebsiella pneumoniae]
MLNATTTAGAQLRNLAIIVICIALLAGINVVFNDYIVRVISTIFIFMILAVSYNLINGVTGQLSLEPNGFVAVGAYVTALLILSSDSKVDMFEMAAPSPWILSLHAGFLPALLISGLCAAALAVCLAVPVFRVRGDYLAIVTLGFGLSSRSSPLTTRKSPTAPSAERYSAAAASPVLVRAVRPAGHRHDPPAGVVEVWPDDESYSRR